MFVHYMSSWCPSRSEECWNPLELNLMAVSCHACAENGTQGPLEEQQQMLIFNC